MSRLWQCAAIVVLSNLLACSAQTFCRPLQLVTATSGGELVSHSGVGVTDYVNNMACIWQISAPSGSRIVAWFTYIDLEYSYDRVAFFDGEVAGLTANSVINIISAVASSSYVSPRLMSLSNSMTVVFITDVSVTKRGFRLRYDLINASKVSCGAISYTNSSMMTGMLTSHNLTGTNPYSPNMSCLWTLSSISGFTNALTVTNMSLGDGDCVRLPINSLLASGLNLNNTYCGPITMRTAISLDTDDVSNIVFFSNNLNESSGFRIRFQYQPLLESNRTVSVVRSSTYNLNSHAAVAVSPYPNNIRSYVLCTAPADTRIEAWFTYLNLQYPNDAVSLYSVINGSSVLLANIDANASVTTVHYITSSNILRVVFKTDSVGGAGLGFRMLYMVTEAYCSGFKHLDVTSGGDIVSHNAAGTYNYLNSMQCSWQITAPAGYTVSAWFTYFNLETCCDKVVLYNGSLTASVIFDTLGRTDLATVTSRKFGSSSNILSVSFVSDDTNFGLGFRLRYDIVQLPTASSGDASSSLTLPLAVAIPLVVIISIVIVVVAVKLRKSHTSAPAPPAPPVQPVYPDPPPPYPRYPPNNPSAPPPALPENPSYSEKAPPFNWRKSTLEPISTSGQHDGGGNWTPTYICEQQTNSERPAPYST